MILELILKYGFSVIDILLHYACSNVYIKCMVNIVYFLFLYELSIIESLINVLV